MKKGFFQKKTTTAPLPAAHPDCIFIENSPILAYHFGNGETAPGNIAALLQCLIK